MAADLVTIAPSPVSDSDAYQARAVQEIVEQMKGEFSERQRLYKRIEDVLHGRVKLNVPSAFERIVGRPSRSPLPQQHRHTIVAALSDDPPEVTVPQLGFGESWQENGSLRGHFFNASWRRQEFDARRPLQRLFMDAMVTKGEGILKTVERTKQAWSGYGSLSSKVLKELMDQGWQAKSTDERRKEYDRRTEEYKAQAPYPITTTDVLPETFFYKRGEQGFTLCVEDKQVPYLDTLARFAGEDGSPKFSLRGGKIVPAALGLPVNEWATSMSGTNLLRMVEVWTWKYCWYILCGPDQGVGDGLIVKKIQHGYGDPATQTLRGPYFHTHALVTHERAPQHAGMGLLTPFLDLYVLYDEARAMRAANGHRTAYAAFTDESDNVGGIPEAGGGFGLDGTEQAAQRQPFVITPGAVLPGKLRPLEQPRAGVDFNVFEANLRADLDMVVPGVLNGLVPQGEDPSGWQFAQRVHNARLYFSPMVGGAQRAFSERVGFESWLIEHKIGERVYVRGEIVKGDKTRTGQLSIGPEDLKGLHDVYDVKLEPKLPSTEIVEIRKHAEATTQGFESQADAVTALGRNPEEVRKQRLLEQFQDSDPVKQRVFQRLDQLLGQRELQALQDANASAQQYNAAAGQPDPGAALGGMNNPVVPGQNAPVAPTPAGMGQQGGTPTVQSGVAMDHLAMGA